MTNEAGLEFETEKLLPCTTALDWLKKRTTDNDKDDDEYTFIKHAIKAYATPQPIDAWLPIESAPRDGTDILIHKPKNSHNQKSTVYLVNFRNGSWRLSSTSQYVGGRVTHWMPLPKPPEDR